MDKFDFFLHITYKYDLNDDPNGKYESLWRQVARWGGEKKLLYSKRKANIVVLIKKWK